ncbi:unnamed protein product [Caenorhabditis nigoni]
MQFWFLLITIFYTILTTPYHFYPAEVRCSVGLFRELEISSRYQLYLINVVYGGIVSAVILLFENRHRHLVPSTETFFKTNRIHRFFLALLNFVIGSSNFWSIFLQDVDQERQKLEWLKLVPCPTELYFDSCSSAFLRNPSVWNNVILVSSLIVPIQIVFFIAHIGITNTIPVVLQEESQEELKLKNLEILPCPMDLYFDSCSFASSKKITGWSILAYATNVIFTLEIAFFIIHCWICLRRSQLMETFSERTKRLQVAFFRAAIAQVAAPLIVLFVPFIMLFYLIATSSNLQEFIQALWYVLNKKEPNSTNIVFCSFCKCCRGNYILAGLINICVLFIPANSAFSTISLLIYNAAYRKFIVGLWRVIPMTENSLNRIAVASSV